MERQTWSKRKTQTDRLTHTDGETHGARKRQQRDRQAQQRVMER